MAKAYQNIETDPKRTNEFITQAFEGFESERKEFGEGVCRMGNSLFNSTIGNLIAPQVAIPPKNSFQVMLQRVLIKLMEFFLGTFSELMAGELIHGVMRGCIGAFDTDDEDDDEGSLLKDTETERTSSSSSRRDSLQKSLTGFGLSSRSGN